MEKADDNDLYLRRRVPSPDLVPKSRLWVHPATTREAHGPSLAMDETGVFKPMSVRDSE